MIVGRKKKKSVHRHKQRVASNGRTRRRRTISVSFRLLKVYFCPCPSHWLPFSINPLVSDRVWVRTFFGPSRRKDNCPDQADSGTSFSNI